MGQAEAGHWPGGAHADHFASVDTVSCPSVGNCSAGGSYAPGSTNHLQNSEAFLVSEKNGVWGKAQNVAGLAKLNTGDKGGGSPGAGFCQISCSSAGNCLAAGSYSGQKGTLPFTVTEHTARGARPGHFPAS